MQVSITERLVEKLHIIRILYQARDLLGAVIGLRGQITPLRLNYDAFVGAPLKSQITSKQMITRLDLA